MTRARSLLKEIAFPLYFSSLVFAVISILTYSFIVIDLVSLSAGSSSSVLAKLRTQSNNKKKACIKSVYSHGLSYKKPKTPRTSNNTVNSSAGPIPIDVLQAGSMECKVSWGSKVKNENASISGVSDIENMNNMVAEEMSYVDSNDSKADDMKSSFNNASNTDNVLELPSRMFNGSNQLPLAKSCASKTHSFDSTKSFALNVEHSAVSGKSISEKLIFLKKIFYQIDGFGGALTPSKFPGIIRLIFTINSHIDQEIIVKEIPVNLPRLVIEAVFSKFSKIVSVKLQLVSLWQKTLVEYESFEMADLVVAIGNKQMWVSRDQHQALLYTLSVGTTAHDLSGLLESYGGKTYFIGRNPSLYVYDQCAVICFENKTSKLAAVDLIPVFKNMNLCWAGFCLAYCTQCTHFGHITANCSVGGMVSDQNCVCLAVIYKKKSAPVSYLALFGERTWASIPSSGSIDNSKPLPSVVNDLEKWLVSIESSLVSLVGQIGKLAKRLESLVSAVFQPSPGWKDIVMGVGLGESTCDKTAAAIVTATYTVKNFSMFPHVVKLENMLEGLAASVLSLSVCFDSLVLAAVSLLERLLRAMFAGVRVFTSGLDSGHMGSGVAIIMDSSLAKHVCKVLEVPSRLLLVKLLFRNRLSVSILELYAGASLTVCFSQADEINFLITRAVNKFSFVIFSSNFNKNRSHKCASFKKCFDLGLVNSLGGSSLDKLPTWCNSCGVAKTIDYVFLSSNLVNAIMDCDMLDVDDFFNTDHKAVFVSFDVKDANELKWAEFRDDMTANASMFSNTFVAAGKFSDLNAMWDIICKIIILSASETFKKKWFKGFDSIFNKVSSRFHKLKLLVSKLVKASYLISESDFALLLDTWNRLDSVGILSVKSFFLSGSGFDGICSKLAKTRKFYHSSKMLEFKCAKESHIRQAIESRMESFELDKGCTIRSVLECPFHKVVLDHLVVDDELVLELELVKSKVDRIMKKWTRRRLVVSDFSDD
ncbi:hypothetical protein G9A89_019005 [Geosiphon pyriformis]|nr:hypothetical protein G9A89_019005 [Geosiphon pyriformis]